MARAKPKPPQFAALRGGRFTGLPQVVQESEAYRQLGMHARALLFELIRPFNGRNNGKIGLSFDNACAALNTTNRRAIKKAFVELVEHGLIDVGADANRKHHKAREYRLTFISTGNDVRHVQATEDYRNWAPLQKHGDDVSLKNAVRGDNVSLRAAIHGDDVSLKIANYRPKCVEPPAIHGDDVALHINKPYPLREMEDDNTEIITNNRPESAAADFDPVITGGNPIEAIRQVTAQVWQSASQSSRKEIVRRHNLTLAEMEAYLDGSGHISIGKQMALRSTAQSIVGFRR